MPKNNVPDVLCLPQKTVFLRKRKAEMGFRRKYKFSIIDHLYYAGRIRRIHNRWSMPLDAIFLWVFAVVPSLLIIRFLYWVIPLWLPSALSVGLVWAAVEVYSKIEKKYFTKARERAYYRLYPERKDKNYFWLQLLLPLCLYSIVLGISLWLFLV